LEISLNTYFIFTRGYRFFQSNQSNSENLSSSTKKSRFILITHINTSLMQIRIWLKSPLNHLNANYIPRSIHHSLSYINNPRPCRNNSVGKSTTLMIPETIHFIFRNCRAGIPNRHVMKMWSVLHNLVSNLRWTLADREDACN